MEIKLKMKDDIYRDLKDGKTKKLIRKNVESCMNININDIIAISDLINDKGRVDKNYCRIYIREVGPVIINHSRQYMEKLKNNINKTNAIGFKYSRKQK